MTQLTKTRATLLTTAETARAAAAVKLLAASRSLAHTGDLFEAAAKLGYPGSVASLRRMLNGVRPAQEAEITALARLFGVRPEALTGHGAEPGEFAPRPRLIEFDMPAPVQAEGPASVSELRPERPRRSRAAAVESELAPVMLALVEVLNECAEALRELRGAKEFRRAG